MKFKITLPLLATALLSLISVASRAQSTTAAGYYFYPKTGTYSYLSGGTTLSDLYDDDKMVEVSLGFTFKYCGTDYTKVYAGTNGFLSFETLLSPTDYAWPPTTATYLAKIKKGVLPLWEDLTGTTGVASYKTSGTSPNRVFTIEFKNWGWDYAASSPVISFQVLLYETSGIIQFIYKSEAASPSWFGTPGGFIGISGGSSSDMLSLNNSSSSPTASSTVFTNSIITKPATDQIYEFAPLQECSGTPSALKPNGPATKVCSGASFTLSENTAATYLGNTYQWKSSPAGLGTFTDITGATSSTYTTSITANTDYQLVTICSYSGLSATTATKSVEVLSKPAIAVTGATTFCSNQLLKLSTAADVTYNYQWINVATGDISTATANAYNPSASAKYTLRVSTSACPSGAVSTDTINVIVKPAPTAVINPTPTVTICDGETTTLSGSGTGDYQWYNTAGLIAGATGTNFSTSAANDYTLVITNPANSCSDTSDATKVISTPAPTVNISPIDKVRICTGLSTTLNSSSTGSGISYQWYTTSGPVTGKTSPSITTATAGKYALVVSAGSCKDTSNFTEVELIPLPLAIINRNGTSLAICPMNNDYVLQANIAPGYTYEWFYEGAIIPGVTTSNYLANIPGNYTVRIKDVDGCIKTSANFKADVTKGTNPKIAPDDIAFCEGNGIILYANVDKYYVKYQWYKGGTPISGETTPTYIANTSGDFSLEVVDSANCKTMSPGTLATVFPLPLEPVITQSGTRLSTTTYKSYQWYRNGKALPGETKRSLEIIFDGIYTVEVSNEKGCYNMSPNFLINKLGIATENLDSKVYLYPNPSNALVTIEYKEPVNIIVKDMQGKQIASIIGANEINISNWADGIYFFTIMDKENKFIQTEKVIKGN